MASKAEVRDIDKGFKNLLKSTSLLKNSSTVVGVLSDAPPPEKGQMNMAKLAAIHEFGMTIPVTPKMKAWFFKAHGIRLKKTSITIPARPFMGQTFDRVREDVFKKMSAIIVRLGTQEKGGKENSASDVSRELGLLGEWAINEIKKTFDSGNFEPLSGFTKQNRIKGESGKPLQNTGRLKNSIAQRVELKGKK